MTFAELQAARQALGVSERAALAEIKARHKALVKLHHPDSGNMAAKFALAVPREAGKVLFG